MMENIFGKQRGRFDEAAARQAQRSLVDQAFYAFAAMTEEQREELALKLNEQWKPRAGRHGWLLQKS